MRDRLGKLDSLLVDAGCYIEDNVKRCESDAVAPYISSSRKRQKLPFDGGHDFLIVEAIIW